MSQARKHPTQIGNPAHKYLSLLWLVALALPVLAEKQRSVQITFRGIQCYKTTDGIGDDQPYAVIVAADLRTGKVISGLHSFGDVGEDEIHDANLLIGSLSPLSKPDDCVLLAAFVEHDQGPTTKFDGGGLRSAQMLSRAVEKITPIVKKYQPYYQASMQWRPQIVQKLTDAMTDACHETRQYDDCIGVEGLRLHAEDVEGPHDRSVERRLIIRGDGGAYTLYFDIASSDLKYFSPQLPAPGPGATPGPGSSIPPGVPVMPILTGSWNSNLGLTELVHQGNNISGTVHFPNQVIGKITGKATQQTINGHWFVYAGHEGSFQLAASSDGNVLTGHYQSTTDPNFKGEWKLTRNSGPTSKTPDVVGVWKQAPGNTGLPEATVTIGQDGADPANFACRITDMQLFGKGKIAADHSITASFGAPNANMTDFGPMGGFIQVTGKITKIDATGRALRIEWDNGVVYQRS